MTITICVNNSEKIALDKNITQISVLTGTLRDETSIMTPTILFAGDVSQIANANYLIISEFDRQYFIDDIRSINNSAFEISAHVDVLSTYANQIRANRGIVHKQQNDWNLYLNDGTFKIYQNPQVVTREFPDGFDAQEFVLAVAGS